MRQGALPLTEGRPYSAADERAIGTGAREAGGAPLVRRAIFAPAGPDGTAATGFSRSQRLELERAVRRNRHAFQTGGLGSNALAVGRGLSQTGKGLLLGNPHRGWSGSDGFHQVHLTLPGEYDVAGAALHGMPWVGIGFNGDLAWTHTPRSPRVSRSTSCN